MKHKTIIREIAPGGGLVTPWVSVSKQAKIKPPAEAKDYAEILDKALVSGESVVGGYAKVMEEAVVENSKIGGYARIGGCARVLDSRVRGIADIRGFSYVFDSKIYGNVLMTGTTPGYPRVSQCHIGCDARIRDTAVLRNVIVSGEENESIVIYGTAKLLFDVPTALQPGTILDKGTWTRPPFVIKTLFHDTVEDVDDRVRIGCISHSLDHWFSHGKEILLGFGLEEAIYDQFYDAMVRMRDFKAQYPSPTSKGQKEDEGKEFQGSGNNAAEIEAVGVAQSPVSEVLTPSEEV